MTSNSTASNSTTAKSTTSKRRIGAEGSATRLKLLDAAQQLMLEEGYAAVTSRRVGAKAGLKPQLVHYYFRTMDDLFLAMFRRGAERNLERQRRAFDSPRPLRALWEFNGEPDGVALIAEFTALANHRPAIRKEVAAYAERFREQEAAALANLFAERGIDTGDLPPVVIPVLMTSVSRVLVMEHALGMKSGHAETRAAVEQWLDRLEAGDLL